MLRTKAITFFSIFRTHKLSINLSIVNVTGKKTKYETPDIGLELFFLRFLDNISSELIRVFFEAVKANQVDTVADLIRSGSVSVDEVDKTHMNMTAMHYAAELGYNELIAVLLTFKPNLYQSDDIGYVPLTLAVDSDNIQIAKKLIEIDPDNFYIEDVRESNPQFFDENGEFVGVK